MLYVLMSLGGERYGLEGVAIKEVLPYIRLQPTDLSSPYGVGYLEYHGAKMAIYDLSLLIKQQLTRQRLSSRIIVLKNYRAEAAQWLGLLAEEVTETVNYRVAPIIDNPIAANPIINNQRQGVGDGLCEVAVAEAEQRGFHILSVDCLIYAITGQATSSYLVSDQRSVVL